MTVREDVAAYVRRAPQPVCDDGIARGLGLSVRQHANHKTREPARRPGFDRRVDTCRECGAAKTAVRPNPG